LPTSDDEINYETTTERSEATKDPRILQRIASFLAGSNEVTFNEEEHRRNSNIQSLLEIPLPNGDEQAVEGEEIGEEVLFGLHGRGGWRGRSVYKMRGRTRMEDNQLNRDNLCTLGSKTHLPMDLSTLLASQLISLCLVGRGFRDTAS
jgi:hypothetical protein